MISDRYVYPDDDPLYDPEDDYGDDDEYEYQYGGDPYGLWRETWPEYRDA